jgi:hypothetical protein
VLARDERNALCQLAHVLALPTHSRQVHVSNLERDINYPQDSVIFLSPTKPVSV